MSIMEPTKEELARSLEREQWFAEHSEQLYCGALMCVGRPPRTGMDQSVARGIYRQWVTRAWQKLWDQVPDKYKIDHEYYYCGYDRRQQAEDLKKNFITWLGECDADQQ